MPRNNSANSISKIGSDVLYNIRFFKINVPKTDDEKKAARLDEMTEEAKGIKECQPL